MTNLSIYLRQTKLTGHRQWNERFQLGHIACIRLNWLIYGYSQRTCSICSHAEPHSIENNFIWEMIWSLSNQVSATELFRGDRTDIQFPNHNQNNALSLLKRSSCRSVCVFSRYSMFFCFDFPGRTQFIKRKKMNNWTIIYIWMWYIWFKYYATDGSAVEMPMSQHHCATTMQFGSLYFFQTDKPSDIVNEAEEIQLYFVLILIKH